MSLFKLNRKAEINSDEALTAESDYFALFENKNILNQISELKQGETLEYFVKGLNTHEVFVKLLEKAGKSEVIIANYSLTEFPMRILMNLKSLGSITKLTMLLDYTVYRTPKLRQMADEVSDVLAFTEIHAKIILVQNENYNIVFKSSSNLTKNHRYEIGDIKDNAVSLEFYKRKILNIIDECK